MKNIVKKIITLAILMTAVLLCGLIMTQTNSAQMPSKTPPPTSTNSHCQFDFNSSFTNALQMKDIKKTDNYYGAVQNMTKKYGLMYSYTDRNFHAELPLTREQLAVFLSSGLGKLTQVISVKKANLSTLVGPALDKKDVTKVFYSNYSSHKLNLDSYNLIRTLSVSEIKDLKETDQVYTHVRSLCERYGIDFVESDYNFYASQPVSVREFYNIMGGVFGTPPGIEAFIGHIFNEPINRGEFIKVFNQAMENAVRKIK